MPVTSFTPATSRNWSTSEGVKREETEWFNVISWGNPAEICGRYLERGSRVYIEGRLQTRTWEDPGGLKHSRTEVVADEMIRLDMRSSAAVRRESYPDAASEPNNLFPEGLVKRPLNDRTSSDSARASAICSGQE